MKKMNEGNILFSVKIKTIPTGLLIYKRLKNHIPFMNRINQTERNGEYEFLEKEK